MISIPDSGDFKSISTNKTGNFSCDLILMPRKVTTLQVVVASNSSQDLQVSRFFHQETHVDALSASDHENTDGFPSEDSLERNMGIT